MVQTLVAGQNCPIPQAKISVRIKSGAPADFSTFRLYANGKTRKDADFVFYGQKNNDDGTVALAQEAQSATFSVDLPKLAPDVEKIAFAVTSDFPTIASLKSLSLEISEPDLAIACPVDLTGRDEAALILGELYKRNGQWKFRFIAQGFKGGLKPLAEMYGVDVADEQPAPPPASKVNLSKIVLTKASPRVDLAKHEVGGGTYRVNLNWHQGTGAKPKGLGALFRRNQGIDLDLGAYVRMRDGSQTIIQALGDNFGSLTTPPYVQLMGDDRTGAQADGEWLHINGDHLDDIAEIVIFTFIYEGVPNWNATDGVVRLEISGQPEIETRLTEGNNSLPMCAIARITNDGGRIGIERLDRYFRGHREMDQAFGWGFRWKAGSK